MLKLAFYADDFTGATDALESLAKAGLRTRLFLHPPLPPQCAGLDAIGVAGLTRSLAPEAIGQTLLLSFTALRGLGPRHVHYKVCSTFDSSPNVGSIGRAIDVGARIFGRHTIPLLVAAPALGRYCVFGNLYARYGIGSDGAIHRLDRHPAVSKHPVTPMTEADLRVHLGAQTKKKIGLLSVADLERPAADTVEVFESLALSNDVVLIDGMNDAHLLRAGALIDKLVGDDPLFSVGSSGIEAALCAHWGCQAKTDWPPVGPAAPLLVVSGSCSPVTAGQIEAALAHGFTGIEFNDGALPAVVAALKSGRHTLVYTSRGQATGSRPADKLGAQLGQFARAAAAQARVARLVVAGGDTSSYAARALGIESLDLLAPFVPGAPWCRAQGRDTPIDGMEVNFKGGQVGAPDYFLRAAGLKN